MPNLELFSPRTMNTTTIPTTTPPPVSPGTVAALVAAARAGLDYLQRTNPLEHGNPDLGRTWGALENALEPFNR